MSTHETPAELEHERQIAQSAHESEVFERSDAAKVAAVAAVCDVDDVARLLIAEWERIEGPVTASYVASYADMARVVVDKIRKALVDPDAALERVRAEACAEALRDAADAFEAVEIRQGISESRDMRAYDYWRGYRAARDECVEVARAKAVQS